VVAGTGIWGYSGDNGPATTAQLNWPSDVSVDGDGNIYIAGECTSPTVYVIPAMALSMELYNRSIRRRDRHPAWNHTIQ
jgi:DNA-binding beta-propeller fold protein YncE